MLSQWRPSRPVPFSSEYDRLRNIFPRHALVIEIEQGLLLVTSHSATELPGAVDERFLRRVLLAIIIATTGCGSLAIGMTLTTTDPSLYVVAAATSGAADPVSRNFRPNE